MFKRDKKWAGETIILTTRPNFLLGNKGPIFAIILLGVLLYFYNVVKIFVVNYSLDLKILKFTQLPLTRIVTLIFLFLGLIIVLYIIFKLLSWSTHKYTITTARIITEKGFIRKNKSSMPYNTIQDIQIDQNLIGRLFGIGSVIVYSAYDGNNLDLHQISNPQDVEELMFDQLQQSRGMGEPISPIHNQYQQQNHQQEAQNQQYYQQPQQDYQHETQNQQYYQQPQQDYQQEAQNQQYYQQPQQDYQQEAQNQQYYQQPQQDYQQTEYPINNQQNEYNNQPNNETLSGNEFKYSTNTYTMNTEDNFHTQSEEPRSYTTEEFNQSINEAIKNLNGDVRFQQQETVNTPEENIQQDNIQQDNIQQENTQQDNIQQDNIQQEKMVKNNEPHNLYDDSIKETYSSEKENYIQYHDDKRYDSETERENVMERHKSKFNKYKR